MTLYLKYRPQRIADLDLVSVRDMLVKMLRSKTMPHAWLFSGPRGTGKTSSARILAKAVNCEHPQKAAADDGFGEPCNACDSCVQITAGTAVDIMEIDAASNRGIDEIRDLREKVKLAPMRAVYKIYIIDEVHMLTTEAANALLKTLEEPPAHTMFFLCTTEPDKLPDTVVSRCTKVNFRIPTASEAAGSLRRVAVGEGFQPDEKALELITKSARGSFRDATKLLEQIIMAAGEVSLEAVTTILDVTETQNPAVFVDLLCAGDVSGGLDFVRKMTEEGVNPRRFTEAVTEEVRQRLIQAVSGGTSKPEVKKMLELVESLDRAYERMKTAAVPTLTLEVLIIQLGRGSEPEKKPAGKAEQPADTVKPVSPKSQEPVKPEKTASAPAQTSSLKEAEKEEKSAAAADIKLDYAVGDVKEKWQEIMKAVRPKNHSVEALLRSTKPLEFDGRKLVVEVFYKFHKDKLESDKCRQIVEGAVTEAMGINGVRVSYRLGQKGAMQKEELTAQGVGEDILKAAAEIFKTEVM